MSDPGPSAIAMPATTPHLLSPSDAFRTGYALCGKSLEFHELQEGAMKEVAKEIICIGPDPGVPVTVSIALCNLDVRGPRNIDCQSEAFQKYYKASDSDGGPYAVRVEKPKEGDAAPMNWNYTWTVRIPTGDDQVVVLAVYTGPNRNCTEAEWEAKMAEVRLTSQTLDM